MQVLVEPDNPSHVVLRWSFATEGFLFSLDGGRTFSAMCSGAITPTAAPDKKLRTLTTLRLPGATPTLLDANGKLIVATLGVTWTDDGTGCTWSRGLEGEWLYAVRHDPVDPSSLVAISTSNNGVDGLSARAVLKRRNLAGEWSEAGALMRDQPMQRVYGGVLIVGRTPVGVRYYASAAVSVGELSEKETWRVFRSDDQGLSWTQTSQLPPDQQEEFVLLAFDPNDPGRVLAVNSRDSAADTLLLSEDGAQTFHQYGELREVSGAVFDDDGRVFIGDAGDSTGNALGGLWTAAKLGLPLEKVQGTQFIDCLDWEGDSGRLRVCQRDRFGVMDPLTGVFTEYARIGATASLLTCPSGPDVIAACETQLNAGPSWCCAGHYPFTPFCSNYDVTLLGAERVYCGVSGRAYDEMIGRFPRDYDAGTRAVRDEGSKGTVPPDAGRSSTSKASSAGGCGVLKGDVHAETTTFIGVLAMLVTLRRKRRVM